MTWLSLVQMTCNKTADVVPCECGAPSCKGWMTESPQELAKAEAEEAEAERQAYADAHGGDSGQRRC